MNIVFSSGNVNISYCYLDISGQIDITNDNCINGAVNSICQDINSINTLNSIWSNLNILSSCKLSILPCVSICRVEYVTTCT